MKSLSTLSADILLTFNVFFVLLDTRSCVLFRWDDMIEMTQTKITKNFP